MIANMPLPLQQMRAPSLDLPLSLVDHDDRMSSIRLTSETSTNPNFYSGFGRWAMFFDPRRMTSWVCPICCSYRLLYAATGMAMSHSFLPSLESLE